MRKTIFFGFLVLLFTSSVFFSTQVQTIYGGDAGDILSAILVLGIPHPPGYPLFTVLGILVNKVVQAGTPAYRVGFLSSIPGVISGILLYSFLYAISGRAFYSFVTVLTVFFTYPVFLYSVVVEVFSLNNLFLTSLVLCSYIFSVTRNIKFLYLSIFIFSLSLSHHHIILFILPAIFLLIKPNLKKIKKNQLTKTVLIFVSGLIPYFYIYLSSKINSPLNWMGEFDFNNFMKLILRTIYGTFTAGRFINQDLVSRLLNVFAFFDFFYRDFYFIGILIILLGVIRLNSKYKKINKIFLYAVIPYIFLIFYASFPLADNFMLATFERYLIPIYIILSIPFVFGLEFFASIIFKTTNRLRHPSSKKIARIGVGFIVISIPFLILVKNYSRISLLRNDFTAELFAEDIFKSVDKRAVLFISADTPLFNSQYVYYKNNKKYRDIALIHFSKLYLPFYIDQLKTSYPDINFVKELDENYNLNNLINDLGEIDIYSKQNIELESGKWIPWGLVYKYMAFDKNENHDDVINKNEELWNQYQDPLAGSLSKYKHLFLSDILRWYAIAHQETALYEARNGKYNLATKHLIKAKSLNQKDEDNYILQSQILIAENKCTEAEGEIRTLEHINNKNSLIYYLRYLNFSICYKDEKEAAKWLSFYEKNSKEKETPLKKI